MCGSPATLARHDPPMRPWTQQIRPVAARAGERRSQFEDPFIQHAALSLQVDHFSVDMQEDPAGAVDQQW